MNDQIISQEGYEKLQKEYDHLTTVKRMDIADRIQKAKEQGDLSENAEYSEAKDAQAFNEGRIAELSAMLKNLTIVENGTGGDVVAMGSTVLVKSKDGTEKSFVIVSFNESDPGAGMISNESPLGHAFVGRKKGDVVMVETPKGTIEYQIKKIS